MDKQSSQPPEGKLIEDAADHLDLSIREAARRAGLSYGRWRQIVKGYQNVSPGSYAEVTAPAKTLAKMARVVGLTPAQLAEAGRDDAARELEALPTAVKAAPPLAAVPSSGATVYEIAEQAIMRDLQRNGDALEVRIWSTRSMTLDERARLINDIRAERARQDGDTFAEMLNGEQMPVTDDHPTDATGNL